jgi:cellulose synthase/poly-beta-1,6-N-acetylglucosamine synthase-like glycosyltransferase
MFLSLFLVCATALVVSTVLLLAAGHRLRISSRILGLVVGAAVTLASGEAAAAIWKLPSNLVVWAEAVVFVAIGVVALGRPRWNPVGHVFFGAFLASALAYLAFAADVTVAGGLSPIAVVASALLFVLEFVALFLSLYFAFESLDVVTRTRWDRPIPDPDPSYRPKVSLQVPAYNEPPDMLIETITSLEAIDYPNFEIVVIDNNTSDPDVWRPVAEYCEGRPNVTFVHVEGLEGFKSGALNLSMREHTAPDAELVGIVDADYTIDPSYLSSVVGYFADPNLAFVQTPQDYREYSGDRYLTACYDAYRYFFATSMPSRNERDSIIFAGTMGLIRRKVLEELGGWNEWVITEDAEASLRMLKAGHSGLYLNRSFGRGIMPLTFASLKSQRFRWCFGGMQILRLHWRDLLPGRRDPVNRLSGWQKFDYLMGSAVWLNDLVYLGFTIVLLTTGILLLTRGHVGIRPLLGTAVLLPATLVGSGLLRAAWALRHRTRIGVRRAVLAFANWLSMSWTVALACVQGMLRRRGTFLRTPKTSEDKTLWSALWSARSETALALGLWTLTAAVGLSGHTTPFVLGLMAWQGLVYASAPYMSWLNTRSELPPELERRRRTERFRERLAALAPYSVGALAGLAIAAVVGVVLFLGQANPGSNATGPFTVPHRAAGDKGPLTNVITGSHPSSSAPAPAATTGQGPTASTTGPTGTTGGTTTGPTSTGSTTAPATTGSG